MNARRLAAGLALALSCGLLTASDDPKTDKDLEGSWVVVSALRGGEKGERPVGDRFTFKDGQITIKPDESDSREQLATYTVDPSRDPKQINLTPKAREGTDQESPTLPGIYKIEDGKLIVCFSTDRNVERPTSFASEVGSRTILAVLERRKD